MNPLKSDIFIETKKVIKLTIFPIMGVFLKRLSSPMTQNA